METKPTYRHMLANAIKEYATALVGDGDETAQQVRKRYEDWNELLEFCDAFDRLKANLEKAPDSGPPRVRND